MLNWSDIVAITTNGYEAAGLKQDGTVVYTGLSKYDLSGWKLFPSVQELAQRKTNLNSEKSYLQTELAHLKGLFSGIRRKAIEKRLSQIDDELRRL